MKRKRISPETISMIVSRRCICGSNDAPGGCMCGGGVSSHSIPCICSPRPPLRLEIHTCAVFERLREETALIASYQDINEAVRRAFRAMRALYNATGAGPSSAVERCLQRAIGLADSNFRAATAAFVLEVVHVSPLVELIMGYARDALRFMDYDLKLGTQLIPLRLICSGNRLGIVQECAEIMAGGKIQPVAAWEMFCLSKEDRELTGEDDTALKTERTSVYIPGCRFTSTRLA